MRYPALLVTVALALGLALSGCGSLRGPGEPEAERAERLRIPPDVTANGETAAGLEPAPPAESLSRLLTPAEDAVERPILVIERDFFQVWRMVGQALDRAVFTVEDRDRSRGLYFIRYDLRADVGQRKKGFFGSLAFWRRDEPDSLRPYILNLRQEEGVTRVAVADEDGEPAEAEIAQRILSLVQEQLR